MGVFRIVGGFGCPSWFFMAKDCWRSNSSEHSSTWRWTSLVPGGVTMGLSTGRPATPARGTEPVSHWQRGPQVRSLHQPTRLITTAQVCGPGRRGTKSTCPGPSQPTMAEDTSTDCAPSPVTSLRNVSRRCRWTLLVSRDLSGRMGQTSGSMEPM